MNDAKIPTGDAKATACTEGRLGAWRRRSRQPGSEALPESTFHARQISFRPFRCEALSAPTLPAEQNSLLLFRQEGPFEILPASIQKAD